MALKVQAGGKKPTGLASTLWGRGQVCSIMTSKYVVEKRKRNRSETVHVLWKK